MTRCKRFCKIKMRRRHLWMIFLACAMFLGITFMRTDRRVSSANRTIREDTTKNASSTVWRQFKRVSDFMITNKPVSTLSVHFKSKPDNVISNCTERRHVVYIRIPKTGSSTMTFIIWRFGIKRGLTFLFDRGGEHEGRLAWDTYYLPSPGKTCDLMANHVIYRYPNIKPYFPSDVQFIAMLREPMSQLHSTVYYFRHLVPGQNKVKNYLRDSWRFEPRSRRSFTHNPLMSFMGLHVADFNNTAKIEEKIKEVDNRFVTVLILEKFDESLLILKRKLCWSTKDILYKIKNKNKKKPIMNVTSEDYMLLQQWSRADYMLYEHFKAKLEKTIEMEGTKFQQELSLFRSIQKQATEYCTSAKSKQSLTIDANIFSPRFKITFEDCKMMKAAGRQLLIDLMIEQKKHNFCG